MILFSVSVRRYGSGKAVLMDSGMGILAAELGDDVVEVLLRAEAFPFEHFHNRGNLLHVGDGRFLDGHGFAFMAIVHGIPTSVEWRSNYPTCCRLSSISRPRIGVSSALAARVGSKYSRRYTILPPVARRNNTYSCE
jgi:hypothetical protein